MCRSTAQGGRRCTGHGSTSTATSTTTGGQTLRQALDAAGVHMLTTPYLVTALAQQDNAVKNGRPGTSYDSEIKLGRDLLRSSGRTDAQIDAIEQAWRTER